MVRYTISDSSSSNRINYRPGITDWIYLNEPVTEAPQDYVGFVYVIHHPLTQRYYIGKKLLWTVKKLPPLKGRINKRHKRVESDWQEYWGSSDNLKRDLDTLGKENFVRTIVDFASTKGELSYLEAKLQFDHDVLLDPLSYNGIINCKIHRNHLPKDLDI